MNVLNGYLFFGILNYLNTPAIHYTMSLCLIDIFSYTECNSNSRDAIEGDQILKGHKELYFKVKLKISVEIFRSYSIFDLLVKNLL